LPDSIIIWDKKDCNSLKSSKKKEIFNIDSSLSRTIQSLLIYILFLGVNVLNLECALALLSAISAIITIFYTIRDDSFQLSKKKFVISLVFVFVGMILITAKQPTIEEVFTIVVKQGIAEELIFRLGMLGILRRFLQDEKVMQKETWAILFLNSVLFSLLHHNIFLSTFILSLVYGYLFLKAGIVSSIIAHALWNFYHNLEALVVVVAVILTYESYIMLHSRKKPFFRWYKRSFDASED
jgi:membrane protease YdiL (CAAX protease family)